MRTTTIILLLCVIFLAVRIDEADAQKQPANKTPSTSKTKTAGSKGASSPRTGAGVHLADPFSPELERLPRNFLGHNLNLIYEEAAKRQNLQKGEFETTTAFEQRVQTRKLQPIIGELKDSDLIAAVFSNSDYPLISTYDADKQVMQIRQPVSRLWMPWRRDEPTEVKDASPWLHDLVHIPWKRIDKIVKSQQLKLNFIYLNEYGIAFRPSWQVEPLPSSLVPVVSHHFEFEIPMDVTTARTFSKKNLGFLVVAKLLSPNAVKNFGTPAVNDKRFTTRNYFYIHVELVEHWIFNRSTGEVYLKRKL